MHRSEIKPLRILGMIVLPNGKTVLQLLCYSSVVWNIQIAKSLISVDNQKAFFPNSYSRNIDIFIKKISKKLDLKHTFMGSFKFDGKYILMTPLS